MFEEVIRELRNLEQGYEIPVSVMPDEDGYFDRQCPASECMFLFKVHLDDWGEKVNEKAVCPFCGHSADADDWCTQEQTEHLEQVALAHVDQQLGRAMRHDAERWNQQQPHNSFITITMMVDGRPQLVPLPPAAVEPMQLRIECTQCGCRYAVIGSAYFCPGCGHNDAEVVFTLTLTGIRGALDALGEVRGAVTDRNVADNMVRSIVENGLQNSVTALQRYAEALYSQLASAPTPRRNVFQNLSEGSALWSRATGKQYSDYLAPHEMADLNRTFQQRHLLAHTQGIVDQDYITHSGDTSHRLGQHLVIREGGVRSHLDLIEKLAAGISEITKGHS